MKVITLRAVRRDDITGKRYWIVTYRNQSTLVSTADRYNRKHAVKVMRYAICKATRLDSTDFRFIGNQHHSGQWYSMWFVTNERQR